MSALGDNYMEVLLFLDFLPQARSNYISPIKDELRTDYLSQLPN